MKPAYHLLKFVLRDQKTGKTLYYIICSNSVSGARGVQAACREAENLARRDGYLITGKEEDSCSNS
jgi:hypothetical protein